MHGEEGGEVNASNAIVESWSENIGAMPALEQAVGAAGAKDVSLGGGAIAVQQYLAAGLLDEMLIDLVPVFLGRGSRLFEDLGGARPKLEQIEVVEAPGVTHIRYRVL